MTDNAPRDGYLVPSTLMATLNVGGMATWNATTDAVTLDWPAIEKAAEHRPDAWDGGMTRGIAKILLAAREEGRHAR